MQTVILAGGLATRLRPLTEKIPKSMIRINKKPFLEYQIELLNKNNIDDIVICVGYLSDQIRRYFKNGEDFGVEIRYSEEPDKLLGTAGALKKAERLLDKEFFVIYGDSYLLIDFMSVMRFFKQFNKQGLMTVYENYDSYYESNVTIEGNLVKEYDKNRKDKGMTYIDYGLSILNKEVLKDVPEREFCDLEDLFIKLIENEELLAYEVKQRFYEIGSLKGIREFKQFQNGVGA